VSNRYRGSVARRVAATALAAILSVALEGCGDTPVQPPAPQEEVVSGPPLLVVEDNGTTSFERVPEATLESPLPVSTRALKVSKEIDGTKGGWVRCGRFFLAVSAGAFDTTGTVTMSMPDTNLMVVDLEISPARLNGFKEPVYLAVNTTDTDVAPDSLAMYWMDPSTKEWKDVTSAKVVTTATDCAVQVDDQSGPGCPDATWATDGVMSTLQHFSRYSSGKAGW